MSESLSPRVVEPVGADSELRDRMLFLVGARRSGTNWLERVLTTHPAIVAMPSETYLFSDGVRPFSDRFQHASPGSRMMAKTYVDRRSLLEGMRALIDRILLESMQRLGPDARYLLERTPWHAEHLELIADIYPDARVIHMIRDGRAVSRSLRAMPRGPSSIAEAAEEWRRAVACRAQGSSLFPDRYVEVRYERLLADPAAGAKALFEWLGLDAPTALMDRVIAEATAEFNVDPGSPGVRDDKWRDELSTEELVEIDRIAGSELRELGFSDAATGPIAGKSAGDAGSRPSRRASTHRLRHPLRSARADIRRRAAREAKGELLQNLGAVERFSELVATGRYEEARTLCAPEGWYRLLDDGIANEGRGEAALDEVLEALQCHHDAGLTPLTSSSHSSSHAFTLVHTYRLDDGREWAQTAAYQAKGGLIMGIALYRFERRVS